jgi:hypothetical protein
VSAREAEEVAALAGHIDRLGPYMLRRALRLVVDHRKVAATYCPICSATLVGQCPHVRLFEPVPGSLTPEREAEIRALDLGHASPGDWQNARDDLLDEIERLRRAVAP